MVIEQAKDVLSAHGGMNMHQTITALCNHAHAHDLRLSDLARTVAEGTTDLDAILPHTART